LLNQLKTRPLLLALCAKDRSLNKINISEKFELFLDEWTPKILAESNGQLVKIAKGTGEL
jgi:hypothetical protein